MERPEAPPTQDDAFYVQTTGQIESGDFGPLDNLYCRYSFHFGNDWTIASVIFYCFSSCGTHVTCLSSQIML